MNQINYDTTNIRDNPPTIINPNESHMGLELLCDTSGSTEPMIPQIMEGLKTFKNVALDDEPTRGILDVCMTGFNHKPYLIQDWVPVEHMITPTLTASGGTSFVPAIRMALDKINERVAFYKQTIGPNFYKPWIFMITDGKNESGPNIDTIAAEVRGLSEAGKLRLIALGVDNFDGKALHKLTDQVLTIRDYDFKQAFDWVARSMRVISASAPGEKPQLPDLPKNVDKDVRNWA